MLTRNERYLLAAALFLLSIAVYVHLVAANAADKNWLLTAAAMRLSGKRLYSDIFEINPPLIVWLYSVPVWLAGHLRFVFESNMLALIGFAAVGTVIEVCMRLIRLHPAFAGEKKKQLFFTLLLAYVFLFCTAPMYFFDREHILLVLTFPYALRFSPGIAQCKLPLRLRLAIGILAAIGFCIKPHAVVVFAVLHLLYLKRERSPAMLISLENVIVCLAAAMYVSAIVLFMPEYLHVVLPMAMETYSAYSRKTNGIYSLIVFIVTMSISFADFRPRHHSPLRRDIYYFLGLSAGYLVYALLNNGWVYTYNPLISMARFLAGWLLLEYLWLKRDAEAHGQDATKFAFGARACIFNLVLNVLFYAVCYTAYLYPTQCDNSISCRSVSTFFREAKQYHARSFGAMSLEFYKWSELTRETGASWDTRFNHLWMLPKFMLSGPQFAEKNRWIIDYVGKAYAQDMNRWKPDVMFVDSSPEILINHPDISLISYFSDVPEFQEAWRQYRLEGIIDACQKAPPGEPPSMAMKTDCRFSVYRRLPSAP